MNRLAVPMLLWALVGTTYSQSTPHNAPKHVVTANVTSPVASLYMFMRAVAVSDSDDPADIARREALITHIRLNEKDTQLIRNLAKNFSDNLHRSDLISDPAERQRLKMSSFADVITHLRSDMSPEGLKMFRSHLVYKQKAMRVYKKGEEK